MEKKTPLFEAHEAAGGKIVPFGGFLLPIEYPTGLMAEHRAVRRACGLFDVSHMGEVLFEGSGALATLNHLMTNDFTTMGIGRCRYSGLLYDNGGMVDDLLIYRLGEQRFLAVVNASNTDKDVAWMGEHLLENTEMHNISDQTAQVALQGPRAQAILSRLVDESLLPQKYYTFTENVKVGDATCLISRTGYTGEDGFELYCNTSEVAGLWAALLKEGSPYGLIPCGLGARDTLRLEASMPLYGHEMDETVDPLETGLGFAVKMDKPEFIGKEALIAKGAPARERIGLVVTGRGIVREKAPLYYRGNRIGTTTSGTHCPFLEKACAMALVDAGVVSPGDEVEAEVRGRRICAEVVNLPFYRRPKTTS